MALVEINIDLMKNAYTIKYKINYILSSGLKQYPVHKVNINFLFFRQSDGEKGGRRKCRI